MSEKRMTRSSSSSIALTATSTGTNHNHHNHNHYNHHHHNNNHDQDSSDSLVLVRESRIRNASESTVIKKSTAATLNATNRKRKLDSTETETTNNDLDDLGTGSSPSSSSSSSKKPASSSSANSSSSTTPTTVSSQLRHSNRRLSKNLSNHVSSSNVQEQSSSPVQENSTTNPQRRTTRVETRAATKRQPATTANSIASVDANNNADDETEQAYLNSVSSDPTNNLNDKIITRRQSCNRLKSSADGANIDSKAFPYLNRRRIPSHPLGLNQSLKLQQRLQDISVRTAASNIENLIDQSSSSSSLASSSTSNTMLAATTSTTTATTSQTTPKATTSRVKSLSSSNSTNHLKNAFKELSNNTTTTTTTNSTGNKKRSLSTSIQPALGLRSSSKRTTTTTTIDRPKNGVDEVSQHSDVNHEGAIGEDECAMMMKVCCPVQGCASGVSLDGLDESHVSYDKCPLYFGMHGDECRTRRVEYERRMKEMKEKLARITDGKKALRNKKTTQEQCEHYAKLIKELKKQINNSTSNPVIKQQQQYVLPSLETTPELLGDIKHLSTSFIITSITNSFAPTPMPHLGATFAPPPTSLASHSLLHNHHHHPLSSSHLSQSHQNYSGSGSHQQLANSFPPSYHYDVSTAGSHGQPHHSQSTYSSTHPANVNFLNRLHPTVALPPNIDDLGVSPIELDFFRDVLVTGMNETLPATTRLGSIKKMREDSKLIQLGNWEIETWYKSPYPDDYWQLDKIFLCQFCLQYMKSHSVLNRHLEKCVWRHPPGREIYRKDSISFFEVDGKFNKIYCQNLCLLAKLFLDHKTLYFDVEPFLFYVLTQYDAQSGSFQMIGYFSKEKQSIMNYNLSCILILPQFMTQGFGRLLIDFSYLLSRVEGKHGSPERPLSDLGLLSYRSYWKSKVLTYLARHIDDLEILVKDVAAETGILTNDIISTLQYIGLVKYWKGKHVILKDLELIEQLQKRKYTSEMDVDASCLRWSPYVYQTIINECESSPPPPLYHQSSSSRTRHSTSGSYD